MTFVLRLHNPNKVMTNRNDRMETLSVPACVSLLRVVATNVCSMLAMMGGECVNMNNQDL